MSSIVFLNTESRFAIYFERKENIEKSKTDRINYMETDKQLAMPIGHYQIITEKTIKRCLNRNQKNKSGTDISW